MQKNLVKTILSLTLALMLTLSMTASFATVPTAQPISTIKFDKMYYSIAISETLNPKLLSQTGKNLTIKTVEVTDGKDVLKVEKGNVLKPLKLGYASITATATTGEKATTSVNVYEGIICPTYKLALTVGETAVLDLKSKAGTKIISELQYVSIDPTIATIDNTATVTGLAPGETSLNIGNSQESILVQVKVFPADDPGKAAYNALDNLNIQLFNTYLTNGTSILEANPNMQAYPNITDGSMMVLPAQVKLTSSNPSILTVVSKGFEYNTLYAKKAGKVNLTLTANGQSKVFPVTIAAEPQIKSLKIIKKDNTYNPVTWDRIKIGLDMYLVLQVTYADGTTRELMGTYQGVTWKSSNPSIAIVDEHRMQGLKVGTVTITATYRGKSTSFKMNIVTGQH